MFRLNKYRLVYGMIIYSSWNIPAFVLKIIITQNNKKI